MSAAAKGRYTEHTVRDHAIAYGCTVIRAAGSKGSADLIVVGPRGDKWAVDVKRARWASPAQRLRMLADWHDQGVECVAVNVLPHYGMKGARWARIVAPSGALEWLSVAPWVVDYATRGGA